MWVRGSALSCHYKDPSLTSYLSSLQVRIWIAWNTRSLLLHPRSRRTIVRVSRTRSGIHGRPECYCGLELELFALQLTFHSLCCSGSQLSHNLPYQHTLLFFPPAGLKGYVPAGPRPKAATSTVYTSRLFRDSEILQHEATPSPLTVLSTAYSTTRCEGTMVEGRKSTAGLSTACSGWGMPTPTAPLHQTCSTLLRRFTSRTWIALTVFSGLDSLG